VTDRRARIVPWLAVTCLVQAMVLLFGALALTRTLASVDENEERIAELEQQVLDLGGDPDTPTVVVVPSPVIVPGGRDTVRERNRTTTVSPSPSPTSTTPAPSASPSSSPTPAPSPSRTCLPILGCLP
jgi:hypothetical protein